MEEPHRAGPGGILGLIALLDEHYEAVEADLAYRCGPADQLHRLWTGGLSFRRLGVLIQGLPPESLTKAALIDSLPPETMRPDDTAGHGPWSREMHLLAAIRDEIRVSAWQYAASVNVEAAKRPPPEPTPRPGIAPVIDIAAQRKQRAYLDRVRAGHGTPTPRTEAP